MHCYNLIGLGTSSFSLRLGHAAGLTVPRTVIQFDQKDENVILSARNLPEVRTVLSGSVNVYDVLKYDNVVITKAAVAQIEEVYA